MDWDYSYGRHTVNGTEYKVTLNNVRKWVDSLFSIGLVRYINEDHHYKELRIEYKIIPYAGGHFVIYWKEKLVLDCTLYAALYTSSFSEFHYGRRWIEQFLELYENEYMIKVREKARKRTEELLKQKEEQGKKFSPLKDI